MRSSLSAVFALSAALLAGCSSSNATPGSSDAGGTTGNDASLSSDGASNGTPDASGTADAGPQCLTPSSTAQQCRTCCEGAYPAGYQSFSNLTLTCACEPQFCGPLEAGAPEAGTDGGSDDAGPDAATDAGGSTSEDAGASAWDGGYGQGVCSAATCGMTQEPSADCNTCIYNSLGEVSNVGPCGSQILGTCFNDTNCYAFFGCVENCPPE